MFGRKPPTGPGETPQPADRVLPTSFQPSTLRPSTTPPPRPSPVQVKDMEPVPPPRPAPAPAPVPASVAPASPPPPPRRPAEPVRLEPVREQRKLVIGRDITLAGEIASCDHLIVEGTVEASVKDCHRLEVADGGLFRGAVEIHEAEIAGRFEGSVSVQGRLVVRSTGRIDGKVQYGELAVDAGGTIDGEIRCHGKVTKPEKAGKPMAEAPLLDKAHSEDSK